MTPIIVLLSVPPEMLMGLMVHMEMGHKLLAGLTHCSGNKCKGWVIATHPEICSVSVWVEE